jgi:hypothetical protein
VKNPKGGVGIEKDDWPGEAQKSQKDATIPGISLPALISQHLFFVLSVVNRLGFQFSNPFRRRICPREAGSGMVERSQPRPESF